MHRFNMRCSFFCALVLSLFGCGDGTNTPIVDTPEPIITAAQVRSQLDALPTANTELSALQVELGRLLFWDPVLSVAQDTACASCHHPDFDYADGCLRLWAPVPAAWAQNAEVVLEQHATRLRSSTQYLMVSPLKAMRCKVKRLCFGTTVTNR